MRVKDVQTPGQAGESTDPVRLDQFKRTPTETIDFGKLFASEISSSGSFDIREVEETSLGKLLNALPIPALLVDPGHSIIFANTAWAKITTAYQTISGRSISSLFPKSHDEKNAQELLEKVFFERAPKSNEALLEVGQNRIWARIHWRSLRLASKQSVLVLIEDLTAEMKQLLKTQKQKQELEKGQDELEKRVVERTAELNRLNEELRREITVRNEVENELRRAHEQLEKRVRERTEELKKINVKHEIEIEDRKQVEQALQLEQTQLLSIFDSINEIIYVADPETYRIIYANKITTNLLGTNPTGGTCYEVLQRRSSPCDFCTNDVILKEKGKPYRWEYHSSLLGRDFILTDRIIKWPSGRDVRFELAIDITDRKRTEIALRESEEFNRKLVEHAPLGIIQLDVTGAIEYFNPASTRMFSGLDGKAPLAAGVNFFELPLLGEQSHVREQFQRIMHGTYVSDIELSYRSPEGAEFTLMASGTPRVAPDGTVTGAIIMCVDITERKKAEEALKTSEEKYRVVVEKAIEGILIVQDGRVKFANPKFIDLFGFEEEDLAATPFSDLIHPYDREKIVDGFHRRLGGKKSPDRATVRIRDAKGSIKWADVKSVLISWEGRTATLVFLRDVSDKKKAEEERLLLATAIEQASETVIVTDASGVIQYVNPAFERITGYAPEEAIGRTPSFLKSDSYQKDFYERLWKTVGAGQVWTGRFTNRRKDGTLFLADAAISPVRDSSGAVVNFVVLKRDVTQEVELEKQLLQAQKMEAIGTLAGGVAHDLNNLLHVVLGFSELLSMGTSPDEPGFRHLQAIQQAAYRGRDLVQRILTFSRKVETHPRPIDLNHEVARAKELLSRTVPKMISIELRLAKDLKTVHADPSQIEQMLLTLSVNARDAMPDGGKLLIKTKNIYVDRDSSQKRTQMTAGEYVMLRVADNGRGMDKEVLDRIFEPFYTTKKAGEGTGLGLAMVFGIVKSHNGHVVAKSRPGKGTTFEIYLPAIDGQNSADQMTPMKAAAPGNETILLVDDEGPLREVGKQILTREGYTVLTAESGFRALEIYRERRDEIALVVLDLAVPDLGGRHCHSELLKINPKAKVLMATGHQLSPVRDGLELKAIGFVARPYSTNNLLERVRKALAKD